jgi:hypothetical protein
MRPTAAPLPTSPREGPRPFPDLAQKVRRTVWPCAVIGPSIGDAEGTRSHTGSPTLILARLIVINADSCFVEATAGSVIMLNEDTQRRQSSFN